MTCDMTFSIPSVGALRTAEKRMSTIARPNRAITAPTTSSLRSGLRVSHQEGGAYSGLGGAADFPFFGAGCLPPALPRADAVPPFPLAGGGAAFPFGWVSDLLDAEKGVFSGMR